MYTERPWRMRQYAGFGSPADTNARLETTYRPGPARRQLRIDLPTQLGIDSDDPAAGADAGRLGVAVDTLDDFRPLRRHPLDEHAATFNINASAPIIYAMLLETAERQGADLIWSPARCRIRIRCSNTSLAVSWRLPPAGSIRLMASTSNRLPSSELPDFYPINLRADADLRGRRHRVSRSSGSAWRALSGYLDELARRGTDMDRAASRFSFLFFSDSNFLGQASKSRAARTL